MEPYIHHNIRAAVPDPHWDEENLAKSLARSNVDLNVFKDDWFSSPSIRKACSDPIFRRALEKAKAIKADENAKALRRARDARIGYAFLAFVFLLIILAVAFG